MTTWVSQARGKQHYAKEVEVWARGSNGYPGSRNPVCIDGVRGSAAGLQGGAVAPFTGSGSIWATTSGTPSSRPWGDQCQGRVRGRQIDYVIYDDGFTATRQRGEQGHLNDKVDAMFGPNMSSCVLAVHEIAQENRVPMLVGATSPSFGYDRVGNDWLFRLRADDEVSRQPGEMPSRTSSRSRPSSTAPPTTAWWPRTLPSTSSRSGISIVSIQQIKGGRTPLVSSSTSAGLLLTL